MIKKIFLSLFFFFFLNITFAEENIMILKLKDGDVVQGSPAFGYSDWNKSYVHFKNLPKTITTLNRIEKELNSLKNRNE